MNFHSDAWIFNNLNAHYKESLDYFNKSNIVGIFVQGSQNYNLDYENSDLDTKLIVTPTLDDLIYNKKPISTTHIRKNNEHIDFKDIRLYIDTFRKQNLNFVEILFTKYFIVNDLYREYWNKLVNNRELIAHMCPYRAVKAMQGVAWNKYAALKHPYEGKLDVLATYGYDPKQLHHLLRVNEFIINYINDRPYQECMIPADHDYLVQVKSGMYNLLEAEQLANKLITNIDNISDNYCNTHSATVDKEAEDLLQEVQYTIMYNAIKHSLEHSQNERSCSKG